MDYEKDENKLYVGVVGYANQKFDEQEAREMIEDAFDQIEEEYIDTDDDSFESIVVVSRLVNIGITKIAYEVADERGYETIGIAPLEADEHADNFYDVDEIIWSGDFFGDESQDFIDLIDVLVKIGGGEQAEKEFEMAEEDGVSTIEYDLLPLND